MFFCSVFRIYKLVKQGKWLFSNSNSQVFLQYFLHTRRVREERVLRIQNGALTTQHDTEKRRESFLIWPIVDRNFSLQVGKSFSFFNFMFFFFYDPSLSELIRPGLAVRVDPVRLLYLPLCSSSFHLFSSFCGSVLGQIIVLFTRYPIFLTFPRRI